VLAVGPLDEHHQALAEMLRGPMQAGCPGTRWALASCSNLNTAWPRLERGGIPIVLFDRDPDPVGWRQMLNLIENLPAPPYVIVTSRLADDRLWSEALHLGAYDVLAKPFATAEVVRVLRVAWLRWQEQYLRANRETRRQVLTCTSGRATA
jgi:DNA-binding response OmpR family regulator